MVYGDPSDFPFAVLLYHRVTPDRDPLFPSLSVTAFEAQMRYLASYFRVVSLDEILRRVQEGKEIEPRTVAITFDDGYRDNYLYAHPILKKYRLAATLFVATGYIESGRVLWNDRLVWAMKNTEKDKIEFPSPFGDRSLRLETIADRRKSLSLILDELRTRPETEKTLILEELIRELQNGKDGPEPLMLDWAEIRKVAQDGWDLGSHTVNHTILTKVPESETRWELFESKEILEKELQRPVRLFAYPNGKSTDFNIRTKELVREAGYEAAVTTLDGFNGVHTDPFEIRRCNSWEEHLPSFALKMHASFWSALRRIDNGEDK